MDDKIKEKEQRYNETCEELRQLLTDVVTNGSMSPECSAKISQLRQEEQLLYDEIKSMKKEYSLEIDKELIVNILTDYGKSTLLKIEDSGNVTIGGENIPKLNFLAQMISFIAKNNEEESKVELTPEFINMVVQQTGSNESIKEVLTKYYLSTSTTELIGGNWLDTLPSTSEQEGKYLWYKIVTIYKDPTKEPKETDPICISARDGKDGTSINMLGSLSSTSELPTSGNPGDCYIVNGDLYVWSANTNTWENRGRIKGEQGTPGANSYLHIKYSNDGSTFTANDGETPGIYIGVLTDNTKADSTNFNDYTWSRIRGDQGLQGLQGEKGDQGIKGDKGDPGQTTYFHIKYSANANGNPMTETPSEYIGTYVDYTQADSTDYTKYTWAKFKGDQGVQGEKGDQGIPGTNGADGKTYYLHIKYSNDGGKTFTSNNGEDTGTYIGIYTDTTATDSTSVSKYTWSKIKGDKGDQGIQGVQGPKGDQGIQGPAGTNGTNGKTTYFHIKYSSVASPTSSSQMTETPSTYIGTYVDYTSTDSTDPSKYTWSRFQGLQGEKGEQGIPGNNGSDGKTYYLHIKYSNDGGSTFTSNNGETPGAYIGVYTDTTQADSTSVSKYTWSKIKGEQGQQGNPGDDGRGVEDVIIQYAKNQSTTTSPTTGWSTTMPTYQEGYYLWYRTGVKYTDSSSYVYAPPVCDQSWKVAQETYTQYKQLADKFTWLVKSGDSQSTMQLTDKLFELVSQNITLTAEHINLNGYVSNDGANWSIDNEGNIKAENLKIEGDVGADTLSVNYIDNPRYPATLAGSVDLYVNSSSGNDDYTLDDILQSYDEAEEKSDDTLKKKYKTLQGALNASPAYLNNKNLRITLETNTTEDVYISGFTSGAVRMYLNGKTIYGYVGGYANSATVYIYGGTVDNTTASQGVIHPNTGLDLGTRCVSAGFEACQYVALYKIKVFGADNKPSSVSSNYKVAVASSAGTGSIYCSDVQVTNCAIGFRANNMGCIHGSKTSGVASRYAFEALTGGQISLADASQAGGTTANTSKNNGGQVWYNSPKFATGSTSIEDITAPTTGTSKTITIKSTYGDTYRSTVYNSWKKDGTCRQGDYGYGDCTGCFFFGTAFSELKGYDISKVEITITRNSGGSSSAVGLVVRTHNYSARPSGAPTLSSSSYGTLSIPTGATGTLTITNTTVLDGIKNGTVKGFGIRTTYDAAHYAVCSGNATVKITYTE